MYLEEIVKNMAESLKIVDETTETQRKSRSGSGEYIPCVGTIWEDDFTREAVINWALRSPASFQNFSEKWFEVSYPVGRGKCDLVLCGSGFQPEFGLAAYEWAIENKYVRFIGDNGKNNDYGVTKVVSPYRKDRSSVLDAERLLQFHYAEKKAILMYGFEFNSESHQLALQWCERHESEGDQAKNRERVKNMKSILDKADPKTHEMSMRDLIPLFEAAAKTKGIKLGPCVESEFSGLNRHPLYHCGRVLGWQVLES
jgi:hypothetical protein